MSYIFKSSSVLSVIPMSTFEWTSYEEVNEYEKSPAGTSQHSSSETSTSDSGVMLGRHEGSPLPRTNVIVTEAVIEYPNQRLFNSTANSRSNVKFEDVVYSVPNTPERRNRFSEKDAIAEEKKYSGIYRNVEIPRIKKKKKKLPVNPKWYESLDYIEVLHEGSQTHEQQDGDKDFKEILNDTVSIKFAKS